MKNAYVILSTPKYGLPNSSEWLNDRTLRFYDKNGRWYKDIHDTDHGTPNQHEKPHAHDIPPWGGDDDDDQNPKKGGGRSLTADELKDLESQRKYRPSGPPLKAIQNAAYVYIGWRLAKAIFSIASAPATGGGSLVLLFTP